MFRPRLFRMPWLRAWHTHHLVGDVIRFLFEGVPRRTHCELRLETYRRVGMYLHSGEIMCEAMPRECRGAVRRHDLPQENARCRCKTK